MFEPTKKNYTPKEAKQKIRNEDRVEKVLNSEDPESVEKTKKEIENKIEKLKTE